MGRFIVLITLLAGCIAKESDPREVEDAVERNPTVRELEARVDSLERAVSAILAEAGGAPVAVPDAEQPVPTDPSEPAPRIPTADGTTVAPAERDPAADRAPRSEQNVGAEGWPDEVRYETYRNERLGYRLDYPANLLKPAESLDGGNGQKFVSEDGSAVLAVYGVRDVAPSSLKELYQKELADPNQRITYKRMKNDWFVISGYRGNKIFYERTLLRGGVLKTFLIFYDAAMQDYFYDITEHISFSFEG